MSIIAQSDENTATLNDTLFEIVVTAGITITDLSRAELIIDVRAAQAIGQTQNYSVTGEVFNDLGVTKVRFQRGGNEGALVCHYQLKEYTIASGVIVDRGENSFATNPLNITVPTRDRTKRYVRVNIRSTVNNSLQTQMLEFFLSADNNVQIVGDAAASNIIVSYQTVFIPDQTVHNVTGTTGANTSENVDITSLGIKAENTFCIMSMSHDGSISTGIDVDEFKGAEIQSDTNLNIYSFFGDSMNYSAQLVYRPKNKVQREVESFTLVPFQVDFTDPFVILDTFLNICSPYQYFSPTDDFTNNSQEFAVTSLVNSTTSTLVQKFLGGKTTKVIVEAVELDGADLPTTNIIQYYLDQQRRSTDMYLKEGVVQDIILGRFVDPTTGLPVTTLTILASDIKLYKNGVGPSNSAATGIAHVGNGYYSATLAVADVNTTGELVIEVQKTGALGVEKHYNVVSVDNYNSHFINAGNLKVDLNTIGTFGLTSGNWELQGKRLHLINPDASGVALLAQSTGATSTGFQADGTTNDILASEITSILQDTDAIEQKLPVSGLIASQDSVDNIGNNTRLSIGVSSNTLIPETGDTKLRIKCFLKDETGNAEDPDNNELSVQIRANNQGVYKEDMYDDEALTTAATASTTFTPSYYKMNRLGVGSYEVWYKIPSTETADTWSLVFTYEEGTLLQNAARGISIDSSVVGGATLADNSTNHTVIAKSMKNNNVSGTTEVTGSVYKDLLDPQQATFNKLPTGTISDLSLDTIFEDTLTLRDGLKFSKAAFNGRIRKNFPNAGEFTVYANDNVTVLTVVKSTDTDRTRIS